MSYFCGVRTFLFICLALCLFGSCKSGGDDAGGIDGGGGEAGTLRVEPPSISYTVLEAHPHDTAAFTQGLEVHGGFLYESTGLVGRSSLRKTELRTGKVLLSKAVDSPYFAEGITVMNDTLYQLTWQNREVLLYRAKDLKFLRKLSWSADGWGITHDAKSLYISDGSDKIYVVRPGDLKLERVVSVTDHAGPVNNLNELEYIDGYIYANRWQYDYIVKIDPATGMVKGRLDLTGLLTKNSKVPTAYLTAPGSLGEQNGAVLNGIAWDSAGKKLLVTGKLWPHVFELQSGL
jgi:glutamine cyclotransferase